MLLRTRDVVVFLSTPDGEPLEAAIARAGLCAPCLPRVVAGGALVDTRVRDARSGRVVRIAVAEGETVQVSAVLGAIPLDARDVAPADARVDLVVALDAVRTELAHVQLSAVGADGGAPLEGARAWLEIPDAGRCELAGSPALGVLAPPGEAVLWVTAPGRERRGIALQLYRRSRRELGRVALEPGFAAAGQVVDRAGRPCSIALACYRVDGSLAGGPPLVERSDVAGRFEIDGLAPGRWRIAAEIGGDPVEFDVASAPVDGLRVVAVGP